MKVTIMIRKEVTDSLEAKRLWNLVNEKLGGIPDLQVSINASMDEDEINGVPD